jgi:general secretion pathway protein L
LARLGVEDGFSADTALAGRLLRARQAQDRPRAVLAEGVDTALLDPLRAADLPILDDPAGLAALGLSEPRVLAHGELAHDLRRDPQLSRATARRAVIGWGLPACLALLGFALWMAAVQVETARLSAAAEEARAAALATTRAVFVPDGPILDIRAQVSRTLEAAQRPDPADGGAEADPVLLFKRAASVVAGGGASVDRVDFAAGQGLGLEVTVASFAALDTLADALRADGLRVEVGEADVAAPSLAEGDTPTGVRARLILSADGGQP